MLTQYFLFISFADFKIFTGQNGILNHLWKSLIVKLKNIKKQKK